MTRICERVLAKYPLAVGGFHTQPLLQPPRRLLAVKVHGMGDAVLVRSVIEHLCHRNPALEVGVLAGDATWEVLSLGSEFRLHRYSQQKVTMYSSLRMLGEIKRCAYDAVVCFEQGSLAGTVFLRATRIPLRLGFVMADDSIKGAFLTHRAGFQKTSSMWQSFIQIGQLIDPGLSSALAPIALPLTEDQLFSGACWLDQRISDRASRKVIFHLGSGPGQAFKRWPVARFAALAEEMRRHECRLSLILTGQSHECSLVERFRSLYDGTVVDASNLGSVAMTASIIRHCDLLVSNDTGVMHLGAAMGTPTIGLFGATAPGQWAPLGAAAAHVYATSLSCSPCVDSYADRVPTHCVNASYRRCMAQIGVEEVLTAARAVITGDWLT
jgi:ADP-heptose:LPS heptosyltransferase